MPDKFNPKIDLKGFHVVKDDNGNWFWQQIVCYYKGNKGSSTYNVCKHTEYQGPHATELKAWEAVIATLATDEQISDDLSPEQIAIIDVIHAYQHGIAVDAVKRYGDQRVAKAMSKARYSLNKCVKNWRESTKEYLAGFLDEVGIVEMPDDTVIETETDREYERRGSEAFNAWASLPALGAYWAGISKEALRITWMAAWMKVRKESEV